MKGPCRSETGRIAIIRHAESNVRYRAKCEDCGYGTEPSDLDSSIRSLDAHYRGKR